MVHPIETKPMVCVRLWRNYNHSFLFSLSLQYFNTGVVQSVMALALQYMFLKIYGLSPMKASEWQTFISLPWTPKVIYGIVTDCLPIFGSSKRAYVVLMGCIQGVAALMIALFRFQNPVSVMLLSMLLNLGGAFMDVVVDGMMVVFQREDSKNGSEDLQSLSWTFYGFGGVVGCTLSAAFLTEKQGEHTGNPYICFGMISIVSFSVALSGFFIDKKVEAN
jgi:MFS family permease